MCHMLELSDKDFKSVSWVKLCLAQIYYVEALTQPYDCIWRKGIYRSN